MALLEVKDFEKLREAVLAEKLTYLSNFGYAADKGNLTYSLLKLTEFRKQYNPHYHDVMDTIKRPNKKTNTDRGEMEVAVTRLPVPLQKLIVSRAAAFLVGNPIQLVANPQDANEEGLLGVINKTWKDNKLNFRSKTLAKIMMSETECAELWFWEPAPDGYWNGTANEKTVFAGDDGQSTTGTAKYRLRMKVIAHSTGDLLFPVFDSTGDLIAFGREYQAPGEDGTMTFHFDIYTDSQIYFSSKTNGKYEFVKADANIIGKIPVIYYSQPFPEWHDVQLLIDRFEKFLSNHGDTNDYSGSPIVKVKGNVVGFSKKGDQGKVIQLEGEGADADYMTWDQSTGSLELEAKNLRSLIFDMTDTPDISIEQMKAIGTFSGVALKLLFLNAHLKASDKEETFGESIQRRINFLKAAAGKINVQLGKATNLDIAPKFEFYLPKDDKGIVDLLTESVNGKILSKKTAVTLNPLVSDPDAEMEQIKEEQPTTSQLLDGLMGGA